MAYSQKQGEVRKTAIQILDCTLCLDIVNVPKTLRCGHSFCKNCLANVLKSKLLIDDRLRAPSHPMYIVCPLCKTDSVAFNSLADLKSNFLVNQLVDAYYYEMEQQIPPSACICGEKAKLQCYRLVIKIFCISLCFQQCPKMSPKLLFHLFTVQGYGRQLPEDAFDSYPPP